MRRSLLLLVAGLFVAGCEQPAADREAGPRDASAELAEGGEYSVARPSVLERLTAPGVCYARTYDAAHLAAHPRQTVTRFFVGDPGAAWRAAQEAGGVTVLFGFEIVGRTGSYSGIAICEPAETIIQCGIEGDGGSFTLEPEGDDLRVIIARVEVEGPRDFSPDIAQADNRVMLLRPAQSSDCPTD
jgi:hypothetical protein